MSPQLICIQEAKSIQHTLRYTDLAPTRFTPGLMVIGFAALSTAQERPHKTMMARHHDSITVSSGRGSSGAAWT
jgi:hypothetical protein